MRHNHRKQDSSRLRFWPVLLFVGAIVAATPLFGKGESQLTITTSKGSHQFKVELADTSKERAKGLMFRREMAPNAGMLFDFKRDRQVSMWMKNTIIPLDMLFIRRDGTIANIAARAIPQSLTPISSKGRVRAVLELNGGTAARLGIAAGDRVLHPVFAPGH